MRKLLFVLTDLIFVAGGAAITLMGVKTVVDNVNEIRNDLAADKEPAQDISDENLEK